MTLRPPVEPMLAQVAEAVPGPAAVRAGVAYEQKLDGHRALVFTGSGAGGTVVVQTRRGALVQDRWPDLVAAAEAQLPHGLVLDGELVVWDIEAGRLSFEALQRRAATRARAALSLAARWPAYFVAFDLLQHDGQELLTRPYAERRALLENPFTDHALKAPWTLVPQTTDLATARAWLESWTDVSGVEGILIKPLDGRYLPGYRGWTKIRRRDTTEAIVGAVTGPWPAPACSSLAATTPTAGCAPSAGPYPCARTPPGRSPGTSPQPHPGTRGPARSSRRRGEAATYSTPPSSSPPWSPRSVPTAPSTTEASTATRSASSACGRTWRRRTCPGSVKARRRPRADRARVQWRFAGEPGCAGG
ncbi:RNA ligase family protein [Streptomyces venezuelae]|uniref:ATP-dependent DNA ligase n=1 Tax=Streptomyces venezuelae TaxID=54571 RepID=UPI0033208250